MFLFRCVTASTDAEYKHATTCSTTGTAYDVTGGTGTTNDAVSAWPAVDVTGSYTVCCIDARQHDEPTSATAAAASTESSGIISSAVRHEQHRCGTGSTSHSRVVVACSQQQQRHVCSRSNVDRRNCRHTSADCATSDDVRAAASSKRCKSSNSDGTNIQRRNGGAYRHYSSGRHCDVTSK